MTLYKKISNYPGLLRLWYTQMNPMCLDEIDIEENDLSEEQKME